MRGEVVRLEARVKKWQETAELKENEVQQLENKIIRQQQLIESLESHEIKVEAQKAEKLILEIESGSRTRQSKYFQTTGIEEEQDSQSDDNFSSA